MLVLPILAGAGLLGLLMAGGKKAEVSPGIHEGELTPKGDIATQPEKAKKAVEVVVKSVKAKDWQKAVAAALASGSKKAVEEVVKALRAAGKDDEAKALLVAFKELQNLASKKTEAKKKKPAPKPDPKPAPKPAPKPKALPKPAVKPAPKPVAKPKPAPKPAAKPKPKPAAPVKLSPAKQLAKDMTEMLLRSTRYQEDQALVEQYQRENKLGSDGKYGMGSAKSLWDLYEIVPPNPFYFSSNQATAHQQAADYKRWLLALSDKLFSQGRTTEAALASKRAETVGK